MLLSKDLTIFNILDSDFVLLVLQESFLVLVQPADGINVNRLNRNNLLFFACVIADLIAEAAASISTQFRL